MIYEPHEVRALITTRIVAITPLAGYLHPKGVQAWHESAEPLVPEWEPNTRAHLAFFVDDRFVDDSQQTRDRGSGFIFAEAPITVRFLFESRPMAAKITDWDGAHQACVHILRSLISDPILAAADIEITPQQNLYSREPAGEQGWLICEVFLMARYTFNAYPAS